MIVDCIADLHGYLPKLQGGDLLIVAGDLTANDSMYGYDRFIQWLWKQIYKKKIFIAGNHDNRLEEFLRTGDPFADETVEFLFDSGTVYQDFKIWGSPWTSQFEGINPHCCAYTGKTDKDIAEKWDLIPKDTDILITHGPPFTIRDLTTRGEQVGSPSLMAHHISRLRPKLWVFGHIHEGYGQDGPYDWAGTKYVNASHVTERYQPLNPPIRIIL